MKLAACQIDVAFGDVPANQTAIERELAAAADAGAQLAVVPECALTGYAFPTFAAAQRAAVELPSAPIDALVAAVQRRGTWLVVGLLERAGAQLFNTALLLGPHGIALHYRKLHLPFLGCDRFVTPGDRPLGVAQTPFGTVGLSICYDGSFPETARVLKLAGAQLIVLPTNWPAAARISRAYQSIVRAFENHVHYVACNRIGREGGFDFPGGSQIVDCTGRVVAQGGEGPERLLAELDLPAADQNRLVIVPGEYELDRIAHRRPDCYGAIVAPLAKET